MYIMIYGFSFTNIHSRPFLLQSSQLISIFDLRKVIIDILFFPLELELHIKSFIIINC